MLKHTSTDITTCSHTAEIETQACCFQWRM